MFMTDLNDLSRIIYKPAGYFIAPQGNERLGDVSNVVFSNGWIADDDGTVFIYYASSDTRMHVAVSSIDRLLDYVMHTGEDGLRSATTVSRLMKVIENNKTFVQAPVGKG
jgi:4-O-beta-D-mannosyl-D-glucose phosphorylase